MGQKPPPPKNANKICFYVNSPFDHHQKIFFQIFFSEKSYLFDLKLQKNYIELKLSTYLILIQLSV
jgi:hypothetical protein